MVSWLGERECMVMSNIFIRSLSLTRVAQFRLEILRILAWQSSLENNLMWLFLSYPVSSKKGKYLLHRILCLHSTEFFKDRSFWVFCFLLNTLLSSCSTEFFMMLHLFWVSRGIFFFFLKISSGNSMEKVKLACQWIFVSPLSGKEPVCV